LYIKVLGERFIKGFSIKKQMIKKINILGTKIDNVDFIEVFKKIDEIIKKRQKKYFVTGNADHLLKLKKDKEFQKIYKNAALVLPDGQSLIWAASFLKKPFKEKISGSKLVPRICEYALNRNLKVFFLGETPQTLKKAVQETTKHYPKLRIRAFSPSFNLSEEENSQIAKMINKYNPHFLFVALGAPKQEKWIFSNLPKINTNLAIGVGCAFKHLAKELNPPNWMRDHGLEWLYRLIKDPKHLWKRYLYDIFGFSILITIQKLQKK